MDSSDDVAAALSSLAGVFDGDEVVDELARTLQCAQLARAAGAEPTLVGAALLHDIARAPALERAGRGQPHEIVGANWLRPRLGDEVAWLVGAHVGAKLYLLETEPDYLARLSPESVKSAHHQFEAPWRHLVAHPWWPRAVQLRRWDDAAKQRDVPLPDPDDLLSVLRPLLCECA